MPELPLSLDLHLHHRVVGILYVLQGFLNAWEQVNDLLFANQDFTAEEIRSDQIRMRQLKAGSAAAGRHLRLSPEVGVEILQDLVLVLDRLDDGLHHL